MKTISRQGSRCATALLALAGVAAAADSNAFPLFMYKFTPIADTLPGFPYTSVDLFPSINSSGRIAFGATLTGGVEGIFTRLGAGGVDTLIDNATSSYSSFGLWTSINSLNQVSFTGITFLPDRVTTTFLRGESGSASPIINDQNSGLTDFCGGQLNIRGETVLRGTRSDGTKEIRTQASGPLLGVHRLIAHEDSVLSKLGCFASIDANNTVAFMATHLGHRGLFTNDASTGQITEQFNDTSNNGLFAFFDDVALNAQGGLAFSGSLTGSGANALYRLKDGVLTRITDTLSPNSDGPVEGFSINESGQVLYETTQDANGSAVHLGPSVTFGRLLGQGSLLYGRSVAFAHIGRDAINSTGQIVVEVGFFVGGGQMIARGDRVIFPDWTIYTGGLQMSASLGGSVSGGTSLPTQPKGAVMSFDLTFLAPGGQVDVKLGKTVVQSIAATDVGVRHVISVPLDTKLATGGLQFVMSGKEGASAQIAAITIPGVGKGALDLDTLAKWKIDTSGKGSAALTNVARYPIKVQVTKAAVQDPKKPTITLVNAAVLSDVGVDATADLELASLRLAGTAPKTTVDKAGVAQPACVAKDVNGDKLNDLVCDVELTEAAVKAGVLPLEAMTHSGWGIEGSGTVGTTRLR